MTAPANPLRPAMPASTPVRRVAYVVKRYPRYSETFIVNEILAHEEAGLEVTIFGLKAPNDTHFQDAISRVRAPVHLLPGKGLKPKSFWQRLAEAGPLLPRVQAYLPEALEEDVVHVHQAMTLAQTIREQRIEHVHAHFGSSPATVARLAARFAGVSYSFTAHAKDLYHASVDRGAFLRRHVDCDALVTISEFNRRHLLEDCGLAVDRVELVYNGLDLDRFAWAPAARERPRILGVGRLVEKKGFGDLLEACARLASDGLDFDCRILGGGPLEAELRARIERLGLGDRVELLGPLPQEETRRLLSEATVFAAPCVVASDGDRDGVPTTILEAMALGVPVVSTDVTGIPEVVRDGRTGVLVPQADPKRLADALRQLIEQPAHGRALARAARRLIEERFDVRKSTARLREVFALARARAQARDGRRARPWSDPA